MKCFEITVDLKKSIDVVIDFQPVVNTSGNGSVLVRNSDGSFADTAVSSPYTVPDTIFNITVDGVVLDSFTRPSLRPLNINISPV
jgi:hypothetical protein